MIQEVNQEVVESFINGRNPQERIVAIECSHMDNQASVILYDQNGNKGIIKDDFKPFCWAKLEACLKLFNGNRATLLREMRERGITVKALITSKNPDAEEQERLANGYRFMFYAKHKMSLAYFHKFFKDAGVPVYDNKKDKKTGTKLILSLSPVEQYMIETGKRLFKGYDSYDELARFSFDLETTGVDPRTCRIEQIGIQCRKRGFKKVIAVKEGTTQEETNYNELWAIYEFCRIIGDLRPDVLFGHNSENFDWNFFIVRSEILQSNFKNISQKLIGFPIYKKTKESILKLGGEVETYFPTILWGHNIVDSLHAARRAQAIDSSMESANLKYVTQYLNLNSTNRVYVPGDKISTIWNQTDTHGYALNDDTGDWYKIDGAHPIKDEYKYVSGEYIVERYLLDDIDEADKVELALNEANFLVAKMLPTTFSRACTMGTAGIWKLIMYAWAFENNLALPDFAPSKKFTGGLSRLLKTGYVDNVAKLDYNSLYPSIILTWNVGTKLDIMDSMLHMLNYVLTQREKYKGLKAEAGAKASALKKSITDDMSDEEKHKIEQEIAYWKGQKASNDKKQLPLKVVGNSFFGSFGAPNLFNFGDVDAAEMTTCIGRQSLRLMIYHFSNISKVFNLTSGDKDEYNYTPIVGDSFTPDTPLFIRRFDKERGIYRIDIEAISELIDENSIHTDPLGREYDYSKKEYQVLCRSGWSDVSYVYRHGTDKPIYNIVDQERNMEIDVTEDHSLFDSKQEEIKPSEIKCDTELEYSDNTSIFQDFNTLDFRETFNTLLFVINGTLDKIPNKWLNANITLKKRAISFLDNNGFIPNNKVCMAQIQYLRNCINYAER